MTRVEVTRESGHIVSLSAKGHSGYAAEGEDIVCAALSSVMQTAVLGLMQVAKIPCDYKSDAVTGSLELRVPPLSGADRQNADMILDTMFCGIADLYESYSDYIELEVK